MDEATLSMYASKVWDGTKWCYPHLEKLLQEKATLQAQLDAKDYPIKWASDALDNSSARVAALESQLAAEREAVRVWREKHKVLVEEVDAWREWNDREPHNPDAGIMRIEDARAATDAAKAREGA